MSEIQANKIINCEGMACPMPLVQTKKAMNELQDGMVLAIRATDRGSLADLPRWAQGTGHQYIAVEESNGVWEHYIRKGSVASPSTSSVEQSTVSSSATTKAAQIGTATEIQTISNEQLQQKIQSGQKLHILDVREEDEYAAGHIPGAQFFPLSELADRVDQLDPSMDYIVICQAGGRSSRACNYLVEQGVTNVVNAVEGMGSWAFEQQK
ncbi:sulfurtransferase TusA family protein [Paenibacillus yanchengensis]|uniref:Sulfurtransferase TusA family protein n=1 Tax=Paenibacillus yanchengensis TaxID=2035833 RepID=A0ABW4YG41_9BACL